VTLRDGTKLACARAFVLDRSTNTVTRVPIPPGIARNGARVLGLTLTPDGRYVAVNAERFEGGPGFLALPYTILAVYDRQTRRVDVDLNSAGERLESVTIDDSGRFVSVGQGSTTVFSVPVVVFDRLTYSMVQMLPATVSTAELLPAFTLSADGLRILFRDNAAHVVDDTNGVDDVYIFNRDSDNDGMPDDWEIQFGLNPNDPNDASGDCDGDGVTNLQEYLNGTHPCGFFKRYFAEGAANGFFSTMFAVFNPNDQPTTVVLEFLGSGGQFRSTTMVLQPHGVLPLSLGDTTGNQPDNDFSTVIESDRLIVADRQMTWDKTGYGSHAETAIEAPATTWYPGPVAEKRKR
jgi:hypothetical protein